MRKTPAVALIVLMSLLIAGASPLLLRAQIGPAGGAARPAANADDLAHRTAKAFAPFVRAIIMRRINTAQQIFKMRRAVMTTIDSPDIIRILGRFQKPDTLNLNLVGGRLLGQDIGILLFTVANEEGPIYFKIYYYGANEQIYIDRLEISDDWDDLEAAAISVQALPTPVTVSLGVIDEGGGE